MNSYWDAFPCVKCSLIRLGKRYMRVKMDLYLFIYWFIYFKSVLPWCQINIPFGFIISSCSFFLFYCKQKDFLYLCTGQNQCLHKTKQPTYKTMLPDAACTDDDGTCFSKSIDAKQMRIWDWILHFYETPEALPIRDTARPSVWAARRSWTHRRLFFSLVWGRNSKSTFVLLHVCGGIGRRLVLGAGGRCEFSC